MIFEVPAGSVAALKDAGIITGDPTPLADWVGYPEVEIRASDEVAFGFIVEIDATPDLVRRLADALASWWLASKVDAESPGALWASKQHGTLAKVHALPSGELTSHMIRDVLAKVLPPLPQAPDQDV